MKKNIIIIILTIMVISLLGYITYEKTLNNNSNNNNIESNLSWVDYLLEQEFVSAYLNVCRIDDKYVYNKDMEGQPNPGSGRDINKEELKTILTTIYESEIGTYPYGEIIKSWDYSRPACYDGIDYKYIHKGKEYTFSLAAETVIETEDQDLINILNKHMEEYPSYALNKNKTNYDNLVKDMMKDYVKY